MNKTNINFNRLVKGIVVKSDLTISLKDAGIMTIPYYAKEYLSDLSYRFIYPYVRESYFNAMYSNMSLMRREKDPGILYITTERTCGICNALISNVHTQRESCVKIEIVYTDDSNFNTDRLKPIYDEFMFKLVADGKCCYIHPKKNYVFKITSRLNNFTNNVEKRVEYVVYLSNEALR